MMNSWTQAREYSKPDLEVVPLADTDLATSNSMIYESDSDSKCVIEFVKSNLYLLTLKVIGTREA